MLKALFGPEAFRNVIFESTKWDKFRKGNLEDRTPMEEHNDDTYWDGRIALHDDRRESAQTILRIALERLKTPWARNCVSAVEMLVVSLILAGLILYAGKFFKQMPGGSMMSISEIDGIRDIPPSITDAEPQPFDEPVVPQCAGQEDTRSGVTTYGAILQAVGKGEACGQVVTGDTVDGLRDRERESISEASALEEQYLERGVWLPDQVDGAWSLCCLHCIHRLGFGVYEQMWIHLGNRSGMVGCRPRCASLIDCNIRFRVVFGLLRWVAYSCGI